MRFVIRVDDIGWTPNAIEPAPMKAPDRGLELAQRFHAAMGGLPYLGAIIPACVDFPGRAWLRSKPAGLVPAIHGWKHDGGNSRCEFHGWDVDAIRVHLAMGRDLIGPTTHYVPPFNGVPVGFVDACQHEGISSIWGGATHLDPSPSTWEHQPPPYPLGGVTFVPSWATLYSATRWRMSEDATPLLEVLPEILKLPGKAVLTLHVTWQAAKDPAFDTVREMVELINNRVISPDEYLEKR